MSGPPYFIHNVLPVLHLPVPGAGACSAGWVRLPGPRAHHWPLHDLQLLAAPVGCCAVLRGYGSRYKAAPPHPIQCPDRASKRSPLSSLFLIPRSGNDVCLQTWDRKRRCSARLRDPVLLRSEIRLQTGGAAAGRVVQLAAVAEPVTCPKGLGGDVDRE